MARRCLEQQAGDIQPFDRLASYDLSVVLYSLILLSSQVFFFRCLISVRYIRRKR